MLLLHFHLVHAPKGNQGRGNASVQPDMPTGLHPITEAPGAAEGTSNRQKTYCIRHSSSSRGNFWRAEVEEATRPDNDY
jgi:hypothetical protein